MTGLSDLVGGFEQERLHLAFGKTTVEIKERAVLGTAGVAVTVGFATFEEALDQGGVEHVRWQFKGGQQMRPALAQGRGGDAFERLYITHIYE
jgi:hypothetical protein